ncbi:MAG TPA: alpha/beta fold hydrolase [Propionibacteriaceae bacterium]|nr:alpha/beta fold hydrolase [Propionibacteriaceae bacterium]
MGGKIVVVPGLAVRRYAAAPVERLRQAGYEVDLRPGLAWRGVPVDVAAYGRQLGADIVAAGEPVDVLVGLSAGTQAAAVAAAVTPLVRRLVLVSPTFDPDRRSTGKMLASYLKPNPNENVPLFSEQLPDWSKAGLRRILRGFRSAVGLGLEDILGEVTAQLTIVHADYDQLTSYAFAAQLSADFDGRLLVAPSGSHSWPTKDPEGFLRLVNELVA